MALGNLRFAATAFFLSFIQLTFSSDPAVILRPGQRSPMILPLLLSPPNSSRIFAADLLRRRRLGGSENRGPNARMRLFDDLLTNGYYTTRIWIGTPPQEFALIVDTGSTVTYVPCSTCEQCGNHQDPKFQPNLSSTYKPVKCNPGCTCDPENVQCTYERQYAEMSSSSGVLGEDIISFGNQSELKPQRANFGCENSETGDLYSQHADGIMGLGRGDLSIVDQLVDKGVINSSFSLCYGGMDVGGGAMVLGEISTPSDMVFSKSDPDRSPYYNIELKEIFVAGKRLPVNPSVFDGKHGTVLDSGTTYAYLPEAAFVAFKDAIMNELHDLRQIRGPDPNYNDICFSGASSNVSELSKMFPAIDMAFGNGQKYSLSPENYLFRHSKVPGAFCLGIFQNTDPTTLLGGILVRNTLVTYDRENSKIGFWKTNCSELWKRLHMSAAPEVPPSGGSNSTVGSTPVSAPSEPSGNNDLPGKLQIGVITFDMSLNIKYSNLKPRITELSGIIAKDLGVGDSQVHILNFTASGNNSLTTWAIHPEGSAKYFSNATAVHIISRLSEHQIQLPDTFGKYQLVNWSFQRAEKRTWWQQHYLMIIMGIIITLILGLTVYGIWFIWKLRQETVIPYKPVDADNIIPEQELQPL